MEPQALTESVATTTKERQFRLRNCQGNSRTIDQRASRSGFRPDGAYGDSPRCGAKLKPWERETHTPFHFFEPPRGGLSINPRRIFRRIRCRISEAISGIPPETSRRGDAPPVRRYIFQVPCDGPGLLKTYRIRFASGMCYAESSYRGNWTIRP